MGGRRSTKQELIQLESLFAEGLTTSQIAEKLGRSEAGIRNICYRKRLVRKAEDETKILFQKRDQLQEVVTTLQSRKTVLDKEVEGLKKEKEKIESIIFVDKILLQQTLTQALVNLKQQRPDFFYLTGTDQIVRLVSVFMNAVR